MNADSFCFFMIGIIAIILALILVINEYDEIRYNREAKSKTQYPNESENITNTGEGIRALIRTINAHQKENDRNSEKTYRTSRRTVRWIIVYTGITAGIAGVGIWQAIISRDNIRIDQRPYVLIESIQGESPYPLKVGQVVTWNFQFVNYGHSPAIIKNSIYGVFLGGEDEKNLKTFVNELPNKIEDGNDSSITVPPNVNAKRQDSDFRFTSAISKSPFSDADFAFMHLKDGGIIMMGRIWYLDVFDEPHMTDFCQYTLVTGAIAYCPRHNKIQ